MTIAQLIESILTARPDAGFLINPMVKKHFTKEDVRVWYEGKLWLPDQTIDAEAASPEGLWERWREALGAAPPAKESLKKLDSFQRLARRERA